MSTRAIIGYRNNDGTVMGAYNHSDGYPTHLLREIVAIVERDGFEGASSTLVQYADGWSFVDSTAKEDASNHVLEGYGRFYLDKDDPSLYSDSIEQLVKDSDAQWAYVFDTDARTLEVIDVWGDMKSLVLEESELSDLDFEKLASEFSSPI